MASAFETAVKALPNLGLYWTLDGVTKAEDQSGKGRNGVAGGGISLGGLAGSPTGGHTSCTFFDGVDDTITQALAPGVNGTTRAFGGWIYSLTSARQQDVWIAGPSNVLYMPRIHTAFGGNGNTPNLVYFSPDWAATDTSWAGAIELGKWFFMVLVFNEATDQISLYMNGALVSTQANAGVYTEGKTLAVSPAGATAFEGRMQHFFIVEGNVTAEQVATLYAARGEPFVPSGGSQFPLSRQNPILVP